MSRIGKRPVILPAGVKVETLDGVLTVSGKNGRLARPIPAKVAVEVKDGTATVVLLDKDAGNLYGMYRTILANMVQGVTDGFQRILEIVGVGYKAESRGGALHLALGYSHPVVFPLPQGVTAQVESNTVIKLSGFDKELLGETAARVRNLRKPDVYKNKGIRYRGERLIKKVGKAAGK
jgi:large subunit ribosomal protein L6